MRDNYTDEAVSYRLQFGKLSVKVKFKKKKKKEQVAKQFASYKLIA